MGCICKQHLLHLWHSECSYAKDLICSNCGKVFIPVGSIVDASFQNNKGWVEI